MQISVSRKMSRSEIFNEYMQTIKTNLGIYHPLISVLPTKK